MVFCARVTRSLPVPCAREGGVCRDLTLWLSREAPPRLQNEGSRGPAGDGAAAAAGKGSWSGLAKGRGPRAVYERMEMDRDAPADREGGTAHCREVALSRQDGWRPLGCWPALTVVLLVLGFAGLAVHHSVLRSVGPTLLGAARGRQYARKVLSPDAKTFVPYNCSDKYRTRQADWSLGKTAWCCDHLNLGCPKMVPPSDTSFDCKAGLAHWEAGWSASKKEWCCKKYGRGCPGSSTTQRPGAASPTLNFGCDEETPASIWPPERRAFCCLSMRRGCATKPPPAPVRARTTSQAVTARVYPQPAASAPFLATAVAPAPSQPPSAAREAPVVFGNPQEVSEAPPTPARPPPAASPASPAAGAPAPGGCDRACSSSSRNVTCRTLVQYAVSRPSFQAGACRTAYEMVVQNCPGCSECRLTEVGCAVPASTGSPPHDCEATEEAWSAAKEAWCCSHQGRGCPAPAAPAPAMVPSPQTHV